MITLHRLLAVVAIGAFLVMLWAINPPAIDLARWRVDLGQSLAVAPLVVDQRVLVAGVTGDVVALATTDGREVGRVRLTSPLARDPVWFGEQAVSVDAAAGLIALDGRELAVRRRVQLPGCSWLPLTPTSGGDALLVQVASNAVGAFAPQLGPATWIYAGGGDLVGWCQLGETVAVTSKTATGAVIVGVEVRSGRQLWRYPAAVAAREPRSVAGVFAVDSLRDELVLLEPATGRVVYRSPTQGGSTEGVLAGQVLRRMGPDRLETFPVASGGLWATVVEGPLVALAPVASDAVLALGNEVRRVAGDFGVARWSRDVPPSAGCFVVGQTVCVATLIGADKSNTRVQALDGRDGHTAWSFTTRGTLLRPHACGDAVVVAMTSGEVSLRPAIR